MGKTRHGEARGFLRNLPNTDDCIPWPYSKDRYGYGRVWDGAATVKAHRLSLALKSGRRPARLDACHSCGNRSCVNPRHLRWDTRKGNMEDSVKDGTSPGGERNGQSKLREHNVVALRENWPILRAHGVTMGDLSDSCGISQSTLSYAINRKSWEHVNA